MASSRGHTRAVCAFGLAALVIVAGCGDDDDDAVGAADLDGRTFVATETDGHTIAPGSEITITFTADMISVETGCNAMTGGYTIEDGVLTTGDMAQTAMACEDALTAQELWIGELLASSPSVELDGDQLELESGENSITLQDNG